MIEEISNTEEIENLYKTGTNAPYQKVEEGHGYYGVLIKDKISGDMQCHKCGKFFKHLGNHVYHKHKIQSKEYKYEYGFSLKMPLCNQSVSEARSKIAVSNNHKWGFKKGHKYYKSKRGTRKKIITNGNHSIAFQNSKYLCDEQLYRRYLAVADIVEHNPSTSDLLKHDSPLMPVIQHRFRNLNNFRRLFKLETNKQPLALKNSPNGGIQKSTILLAFRNYYKKHRHIPNSYTFRQSKELPFSKFTIYHKFGSWNRALSMAGFK